MRDIIFRGKRKDGTGWALGNLKDFPSWNRAFISTNDPNKTESSEVFRKTVGQFTGRLDKNGKQVFEGDILALLEGRYRGAVLWSNHDQSYIISPNGDENLHLDDFGNYGNAEYFQIIGNIYDNPELL